MTEYIKVTKHAHTHTTQSVQLLKKCYNCEKICVKD